MAAELAEKSLLATLVMKEVWRRTRRGFTSGSLSRWPHFGPGADRLLASPRDLRHGERAEGEAIYGRRFTFAGHSVEAAAISPFQVIAPSRAWALQLHSFEWLRHLAELGGELASINSRALISDWLSLGGALPRVAADPEVTARRMFVWLGHAPLILHGADTPFRRRFIKSLSRQGRHLRRTAGETADGLARLKVRIALTVAALCLPGLGGRIKADLRDLGAELDRQVFADGGHISRNPASIVELLTDLVPLRQLLIARGEPVPRSLFGAIDRMLPALRFFSHGDGRLALFNGTGFVPNAALATLLAHDESLGEPIGHARQSGYARLAAGGTVVIADVGTPPPVTVSGDAHAGTLAFELSSGAGRIVVNCGCPPESGAGWRSLARSSAAHSTLVIGDRSSSRFATSEALTRFLGAPILEGPSRIEVTREDRAEGQRLTAVHDGYQAPFGLLQERSILVSHDGASVLGLDQVYSVNGRRPRSETPPAAIRFHLCPGVVIQKAPSGGLRLSLRGETWRFSADVEPDVEDSIFFADPSSPRPSFQIVLNFDPLTRSEVAWRFTRERSL
ncbi:heparinase II/III family protein [Consotaella salsifontis]|uniref:heparinase II/III family protein n=1 Tax=Consotaella salsifontis TaxID=1365950 RepID=UPI0013F643D9|nr:heparinase II/III family protein [Consotaella salsifontis]